MAEITMRNGNVVLIDDEDYEALSRWSWYQDQKGYVSRGIRINGNKTTIKIQRVIMNAPIGMQVDHINGDKLDNRKTNLRVCTPSQNMFNRSKSCVNTSGYKGVRWCKSIGMWRAQIDFNRTVHYLGHFKDPKKAHEAYCEKAKELHGEFARFE